jgi:hypothetical protein
VPEQNKKITNSCSEKGRERKRNRKKEMNICDNHLANSNSDVRNFGIYKRGGIGPSG